jgi:hypothetical protein
MTGTSVEAEAERAGVGIPLSSYTGAGFASSSHRDCWVYRGYLVGCASRCGDSSGAGGGGMGLFGGRGRVSASGGGLGPLGRSYAASFSSEASDV